tara:strand:+ start:697 stop:861 length:165 start_codon:yes stop_codon:yes gene_type:complete
MAGSTCLAPGILLEGNRQAIKFGFSMTSGTIEKIGAGDRDRTDDIQLGKLTFYH